MNDKKQLKDQHREKHPGFDRYIECQTRAFLTGLGTFTIGFATSHFAQKFAGKRLPYDPKFSILISTIIASAASYKVTTDRTKSCQAGWLAAEDKLTALTSETDQ